MSFVRRYLPLATMAVAVAGFYLYNLDGVGVLGPDEPRYAAIGESMSHTHQFITPVLWGSPWFEKPPLLYWMTAFGSAAGLNMDLAGRLPVAVLSLAFLTVSFILLRKEFGFEAALLFVAMLATSAGWIAFSSLCLTDLPLSVCFGLAILLALPLLRPSPDLRSLPVRLGGIGALIGFGTLAKGLVPIALAVPLLWFLQRFWRTWWAAAAAFLAVALPWYGLVYQRNGYPFIQEFFLKHHFERLYSASLQHVQPWYYYFPVILGGLFPWFPLLGLLLTSRAAVFKDERRRFLGVTFCFGFVLFSVSLNKLPGYLLPLIPCAFALIASLFEKTPVSRLHRAWLIPCALSIALIPVIARILPISLASGRFSWAQMSEVSRTGMFYVCLPIAVLVLARRSWTVPLLVLCVAASGILLKHEVDPVLDRQVSPRYLYLHEVRKLDDDLCDGGTNRDWIYGLSFYRGRAFPGCEPRAFRFVIESRGHEMPTIVPYR